MIDITYDVRIDSNGKDPDSASKKLKNFHKLLWSKRLPNGKMFKLDDNEIRAYLYHKSELGEYYLSSDSVTHTYSKWKRTQHIIEKFSPEEIKYFYDIAHTVGGYLIFPGNKVNSLQTINQERGMNKKINDRIDLTLECIRRAYINQDSPLYDTIKRYWDFFALFSDFKGYCEYFLLQDLTLDNFSRVNFFIPFNDFILNPLPKDVKEYTEYKKNTLDFLKNRNERIYQYDKSNN
jgi:hypothetical protein